MSTNRPSTRSLVNRKSTVKQITEARDYLALRLKPAEIQLTDRQRDAIRSFLISKLPPAYLNPFTRMDAHERQERIYKELAECVRAGTLIHADFTGDTHRETFASPTEPLIRSMYAQVVGLDALEPLLQDEEVSSITVVNEGTILYEKGGQIYQSPFGFESRARMIEVIKNLAIRGGQQLTPQKPTADLAFPPPQVVRIHVNIDPVTPRFGAFCALRRGREKAWTLDTLVSKGMINDEVGDFLRAFMRIPASIIVGGEPSSGKTTLLEVLLSMIDGQHICLLEQAAELNPRNPLISFFEVPPASETVSLATLTIDSLRKNVQVVVIGETRGSEAGWLLFIAGAMKAILTTLHGRNSRQVVERLAANAQIQGEPPISPFVGNKELAYQAIANAFDFVIHCTQLPDGRRIVDSIEHIAGVDAEGVKLERVVKANVQVAEVGGRKRIQVDWEWSEAWLGIGQGGHKWKLPEDLAFALQMAEVRAEVSKEEPGSLDARLHEQYQRACLAFDQGAYALAVRLFSEVLRPLPTGYLDAEVKLRRALNSLGQWNDLLRWADQFITRVNELTRDREWGQLAAVINELDSKVELRVAVNAKYDLKNIREQLQRGQGMEAKWAEARRRVQAMINQGNASQAAEALRQFPVAMLNGELRNEVRRLRLETLEHWLKMPHIPDDQALRICHEMFALADEESEPELMNTIVKNISRLEQQIGKIEVNLDSLNVAAYIQKNGRASAPAANGNKPAEPAPRTDQSHHLYLQGVQAMGENRWADALGYFEKIPTYRRAGVFIKSLKALQSAAQ